MMVLKALDTTMINGPLLPNAPARADDLTPLATRETQLADTGSRA
jgi:hypothetical protein